MSEIDEIRSLERQMLAIRAAEEARQSIAAIDRQWLEARARRRRDAAIRATLRSLFRLPLELWRRIRSVAIPSGADASAGLRGR